jgi:predicted PurR-regulated permease PerM
MSFISVIMLKPFYDYILGRGWIKQRKRLAASFTLAAFLLVLVIPVFLIAWTVIVQLSNLLAQFSTTNVDDVFQTIAGYYEKLPFVDIILQRGTDVAESLQTLARTATTAVASFALSIGASLPSLLTNGIIFLVLVITLLPIYDEMQKKIQEFSPLGHEISHLYSVKITAMVKSLVMGVFLIAIIQGGVMGIIFWLAGLPYVLFLTLLAMLLALLPMVGISYLAIAIAIIAVLMGDTRTAIIVLVGFYGVVNWIDIILRPRLMAEEASISFALFILAIFGGLAWAGLMGLFYGPVIMLLLVTTVQIYVERYAEEDGILLKEMAVDRLINPEEGETALES